MTRLLITPGEPAGIGPDITIQLAQESFPAELIVIADPDLLTSRATLLKLPLKLIECDLHSAPEPHTKGTLKIIPYALSAPVTPGKLNPENAFYVIKTLMAAADICLKNQADGIVTGPVHKGVINDAGMSFSGHTEFFADHCGVKTTVMLFVVDELKVALVTTHLPLAEVPKAITREKLRSVISILNTELKKQFHLSSPKILVCGLNPHAGENGYLGREEIETITPLLNDLRAQGYQLEGPLPADTIFTQQFLQRADAVLAMYHDQALPLVKYLGFGHAVNVTLGLPFIRTSVDHGTACDVAGSGNADAGSMIAAVKLAMKLQTQIKPLNL
jgi:4-hydroxythreonine-4-phosphate dehydrogenase